MIKRLCAWVMRKENAKAVAREESYMRTCYENSRFKEEYTYEQWLNIIMKKKK